MTVFRRTDRIRKAASAARRSLRHVRSLHLKGMTVVETYFTSNHNHHLPNDRRPPYIKAAAVIGIAALIAGCSHYVRANTTEYYRVMLNGQTIGEISSKQKIERWLDHKSAELERLKTPVRYVLDEGQIEYRPAKAYKKHADDEATLAVLAEKVKTHPAGVQVIVNGRAVGIVRDQHTARRLLDRVRNKYAPSGSTQPGTAQIASMKPAGQATALSYSRAAVKPTEAKPGRVFTSVRFAEKVRTVEVPVTEHQLADPEELFRKLTGDVDESGHITGDQPLLTVQSVEQVTEVESIEPAVDYQKSSEMRMGESKVLRAGQEGRKRVTYRLVKHNGSLLEEEVVAEQILRKPSPALILRGTKIVRGEGTGKFAWPVAAHRITSYMGERWGRMHKGIDLVGGSEILAADDGVVEFAGFKAGGHGNAVIINHNNGFQTLYAHMKSVKVKEGQIVQKGDTLGIMGSTGRSTGTHLHFEIHQNGELKNPTSFL